MEAALEWTPFLVLPESWTHAKFKTHIEKWCISGSVHFLLLICPHAFIVVLLLVCVFHQLCFYVYEALHVLASSILGYTMLPLVLYLFI